MEEKFTITGGIIFALLTEIMITSQKSKRINAPGSQDLNKCTQTKLFTYLAGIAGDKYHKKENKKNTVSGYKKCTSHGANGLDQPQYKETFDILITNNYESAIKKTEELFKKCIFNDEEKRTEFAKRLYWLLKNIESPEKFEFHYNGKICKINEFVKMKDYDFIPFFLSIWHAISTTNQDNNLGNTTFNQLFKNDKPNSEYKFNFSLYEEPNGVTFKNVLSSEEALDNTELNIIDTSYYQTYINKAVEKLRNIKTILYRNPSVYFYDIYVCNDVKLETDELNPESKNNEKLISATPKKLIDKYGKAMTLSAPGGTGKSMFLRHMMLCENLFKNESKIEKTGLIPVLLNLRKYSSNYADIDDFIIKTMQTYDSNLDEQVIMSDFKEGKFLFLFDALDEIQIDLLNDFISKFETFTTQYDSNVFVLSSRPNNICSSLDNFTSLTLSELRKEQGIKLINKLPNIEQEKKDLFNTKVFVNSPYIFADRIESSPLLLTIKFLVYLQSGKILDNNDYTFYEEAYEVLYKNHDEIHNKNLQRVYKTSLELDEMKDVLSEFCYKAYLEERSSFSKNYISNILSDLITAKKYNFTPSTFIHDVKDNLSLLLCENNEFTFIHKTFMEYFAGNFIANQDDYKFYDDFMDAFYKNPKKIKVDDSYYEIKLLPVFSFAYKINTKKLEKLLFLKILKPEFEKISNLYDYISTFYGDLLYSNEDFLNSYTAPNYEAIAFIIRTILGISYYHDLHRWPELDDLFDFYMYLDNELHTYSDSCKHSDEEPISTYYRLKKEDLNTNNSSFVILKPYIENEFTNEYEALLKYYNYLKEKYND